jgi:glycosyltransferase involved in cell wall biosynthesis
MTSEMPIYYDLTEALLSASAKRVQYYGIARVVIETAREAALLDPNVHFVVFSFGKKAFYEIAWTRAQDGSVEFQIPKDVGQRWFRTHFGGAGVIGLFMRLLNASVAKRNVRVWDERASGLKKADIRDGIFVSAARPKMIVDMIEALKRAGSKARIVPLVHDFMPLHNGATKRFRRFDRNFMHDNRYLIGHSDLILTNSVFTLDELNRFAATGMLPKPGPVKAIPLVHECPQGVEAPEINLPPSPYLLTVGLNLGRKNIEIVLSALMMMAKAGRSIPHLVLAGAHRKRLKRYIERAELQPIRDRIVFVNNPNQTDLVRLYENALALIIPSRIEGWGLPAGEALWCGTPALCSTAPVFYEVCGELGLYFDPDDPETLAGQISRLNEDAAYREELRQRIADAKPQLRTWKTVAIEMLDALSGLRKV